MLNYSEKEISIILKNILNTEAFKIKAIGNHELKRHLVYHIYTQEEDLIFKLYYKTNRRCREIAALNLLADSTVNCPRIVKAGTLPTGEEWLLITYIDGQMFDKLRNSIPYENQIKIFTAMGEELGKIHSFKTFNFFGAWDENGNSINNIADYAVGFIKNREADISYVLKQNLPQKALLNKAIEIIRNNYHLVENVATAHLCHNDFNARNVLVNNTDGEWVLSGVIDFEQSYPSYKDNDLLSLYEKYFLYNESLEDAFLNGYGKYCSIGKYFYDTLSYNLLCSAVGICSWAYEQAPDYYEEGIKLIKMFVE